MARPREFDVDQALEKAMRVFWAQGFQGSSFDDLMKAARVQKQSLYNAFGDKHELFLKALALYRTQVLSQVQAMLSAEGSPLAAITRFMRYAAEPGRLHDCPPGCLMSNTALELGTSDSDVAREVKLLFRGMEHALSAAVEKGQAAGEITQRFSSNEIGRSLANTINGIRILENTGASPQQVKGIVDMALAAIRE
jgi:TetR/AcrR family transcriptional regulator, transcriptional repressor for nem operon